MRTRGGIVSHQFISVMRLRAVCLEYLSHVLPAPVDRSLFQASLSFVRSFCDWHHINRQLGFLRTCTRAPPSPDQLTVPSRTVFEPLAGQVGRSRWAYEGVFVCVCRGHRSHALSCARVEGSFPINSLFCCKLLKRFQTVFIFI